MYSAYLGQNEQNEQNEKVVNHLAKIIIINEDNKENTDISEQKKFFQMLYQIVNSLMGHCIYFTAPTVSRMA